jgi:hypothetical protein
MNDTNIHSHFTICSNRQPALYAVHASNICGSLKVTVVFSGTTWQH